MSKNKYVIRTSKARPDGRRERYFFSSRERARMFCRYYGVPQVQIKKL